MSKITTERVAFKPFEYQWAYDYWFAQQNAHWLHTEINMQEDVTNWRENLSVEEKNVVEFILKGFTQTECEVGNYWSSYIPQWFPIPEIKMMAQTFGAFETIHATAYSYLNDTLGLDDFEAFLEDEATMNKLKTLMDVDPSETSLKKILLSVALFSALGEGIQLFSSFAVLLSFRKSNRLKGVGQQMIFSVKDESLHSEAGCKLFRSAIEENPHIWTDNFKASIYEGIDIGLLNEFKYIDKMFEQGELESITSEQLKNFMFDRANRKLVELNLVPQYNVDKVLFDEMSWFYALVAGEKQTDFFAGRETGYAKPNADWNDNDLF